MVISANSQLGLRMNTPQGQVALLNTMLDGHQKQLDNIGTMTEELKKLPRDAEKGEFAVPDDHPLINDITEYAASLKAFPNELHIRDQVTMMLGEGSVIGGENSKYFFICDSVYKAANLIRVNENFTGRTLKDIAFGKYTYLMGKSRAIRFLVGVGAIKGIYYDDIKNEAFEWGIAMQNGEYFYDRGFHNEFTLVMQLLTFIELGDIEVITLEAGRNNGGKKNIDKVTNTSNNTVYVVDSSWNKLIIRTDGFAVRGHFRLQPCGPEHADRKLIWVDAFEKHGYTRRPKAEIIH